MPAGITKCPVHQPAAADDAGARSRRDEQLREKEQHKVEERTRQQQLDAMQEADRVASLHEYEVRASSWWGLNQP